MPPKQLQMSLDDSSLYHSSLADQIGGDHYKHGGIEPLFFAEVNGIPFCAANVLKYLVRHELKGGKLDIEKALDYCRKAIALYDKSPAWKRHRGDEWTIIPGLFIESNKLTGYAETAALALCSTFEKGLAALFLVERTLATLRDTYPPFK